VSAPPERRLVALSGGRELLQRAFKLSARADAEPGGSIVNIGSMWAHQAIAATPSSAYSVAKAGLHALTHNLAIELAPHHIRVKTVAPAVVATPIYERFIPADKIDETLHSFDSSTRSAGSAPPATLRRRSLSCCPRRPAG
jgi:NAD(P)-dependent dehydrogenase (short-subunit alcohol dehydrogenase family)